MNSDVPTIEAHQPFNPYTELQILKHNAELIKLVTKIDSKRFASAGSDCMVLIWDAARGKQLHTLRGHSRPVTNMCLYNRNKKPPEKEQALEESNDCDANNELNTDTEENECKTTPESESPLLLTGASDRLICMWNVDSGVCLLMLTDLDAPVRCLLVLEDLGGFCAGGERLCLWNQDGACLCKYNIKEAEDIQQLIVMQKEFLIAVVDKKLVTYRISKKEDDKGDDDTSESWNIEKRKHLQPHREAINCLIQVNENCFASSSLDGAIILWAVPSLNPTRYLNSIDDYEGNDKMYPYSVQFMFTLEQRYIFAAVGSGFSVYDTTTGKLIVKRAQAHYSKILHINFVYNGAFLATCSEDGSVRLWSVATEESPEFAKSAKVKKGEPSMEKFTKKTNEELRKWGYDVMKPKLLGECQAHTGAVQMCADFGGDGFTSCAADGTLLLWKDGIRQKKLRNEKVMKMFIPTSQELSGVV